MGETERSPEIDALMQEVIKGYRVYFRLLRNYYQLGSHNKIMEQLTTMKALEKQMAELVGAQAKSELFLGCYAVVLNEQPVAGRRMPTFDEDR